MASHCHPLSHPFQHQNHNHCPSPLPPPSPSCTCCCNPYPSPPPPEHHQLTPDQLLQALAYHLHQHQPHPKTHAFLRWDSQVTTEPNPPHHHLVSSLAQRISDLESALSRLPPPHYIGRTQRCVSLRDAAARVIQMRFRAFLVRRSRALGQLQELAYLKARFVSLRSSVSGRTQYDSEDVSRKAMDLLLRVDSIEGFGPLIRDGKRSIARDLVRFLDFVDGFTMRRVDKSRAIGVRYRNGRLGGNQRESVEELKSRVERIRGFSRDCGDEENDVELEGFQQFIVHGAVEGRSVAPMIRNLIGEKKNGVQPRSKKSVRFSENGNVCWVINDDDKELVSNAGIRYANGSDDRRDAGRKEFNVVEESMGTNRGEEDDDEVLSESEGSSQSSDGERIPKGGLRESSVTGCKSNFHDQDEDSVFTVPFSSMTEQRAKKRQGVKIIG